MKFIVRAVAALAVLLVPATTVGAAQMDRATGGGRAFDSSISFEAREKGTDRGHINATSTDSRTSYRAKVTCLEVVGNRAIIGARIERYGPFDPPGPPPGNPKGVYYYVEDNGEPSDPLPDRLAITFLADPPPEESCSTADPSRFAFAEPIERGNLNVFDAF